MTEPAAPPPARPTLQDLQPLIRASAARLARRSAGHLQADDLAQVGMLAAHATLLQAGTAAEDRVRYARQSAKLAMIDLARCESRHRRLATEDSAPDHPCPAAGPEAQALKRQMARLVATAIGELPRRLQDVLRLMYETEMTQRELAAIWGLHPSEVCHLHTQAIAQLRTLLGLQEPAEPPRSSSTAEMFAPDIVRGVTPRLLAG